MAPTKTATAPKRAAPTQQRDSRTRYYFFGGAIVVIGLVVWLVVGISSSPGSTTTTTSPAGNLAAFQHQITTSLTDTEQIFSKFKHDALACSTDVCVENVANTALLSEGLASNLVQQQSFPTAADPGSYVKLLVSFQESYKGLSEGASRSDVPVDIKDLSKGLAKTITSAHQVEAEL
jgi:hypothetical protein